MGANHLGELEHLVLLAVVRLRDEAYGMSVLRELEERAKRSVSRGALYLILERMVRKGYLDTRMDDATPARGGRAKRFFRLTDRGKDALRVTGQAVMALWDGMESLLEEGS